MAFHTVFTACHVTLGWPITSQFVAKTSRTTPNTNHCQI